jgi:autotransporter-associated beta strand protein
VNSTINANSLVLRVSDFYASTPMTLAGTGQINLTTGVVLSAHAGFDSSGTTINSTPGNVVNVAINAGTNELIIHSPSAVSFNGVLSGSGGMTKSGGRTAFFNANNTYTGETNLTGFVRFNKNVPSGAASPFGNSTTAINLWSGNFSPINPGTAAANGAMAGILAADNNSGALTFDRALNVKGSGGGLLRNFSNGALTMNGAISIDAGSQLTVQMFGVGGLGSDQMILAGPVSGAGKLVIRDVASGGATAGAFVRLAAANPGLTGGVDIGGRIQVENNGAFGTGSITMSNTATLSSTTGARNISNPIFHVAGSLAFEGTNPFELSGTMTNVGGEIVNLVSTNTASVTISGNIVRAGGFWKTGPGTVVLSGANTFNGLVNVGNGTVEGGMVVLASNGAAGTSVGHIGVNNGQNALGIQGNITLGDELIFLRGNGIGDLGALRNLSGTNTMAGRVQAAVANTIGVDAGQLNVGRSWFSIGAGTEAGTAVARKVGPGVLQIGSELFTATRSGGGTSQFQGAIIADRLDIAAGTVRIQPSTGGNRRVSDVGSVSLAAGTSLDLTDNALVVDYGSADPSPLADIRSKIVTAYNGGAWNGDGITSSSANNSTHGLGYAEASNVLTFAGSPPDALFLGDVVDQSAVLVRYTRYGDADLSGTVNLQDFNRLAANFGTGTRWDQGDFTYDGAVNLTDFNRLAANFGLSAAGPSVTPGDWARLGAAIPEPSSLALAALGASALLRRRRKA